MKREFKFLKRNQVAIYAIALMLMTAGYLNYTTNNNTNNFVETSLEMESDDSKLADIGDATLVNSNDVITVDTETIDDLKNTNTTAKEVADKTENKTKAEEENVIETNSKVQDDYFTKSKLERDTMYSQMIETYEKVINSSNTLETQKQSATEEITKINNAKNSIMICENLIKTKGRENIIIFVNGESISVIVGGEELKQEEIAQIQNIISRELNAQIENIHISNK